PVRYRLLETTRDYAFQKLLDAAEVEKVARWHAIYFLSLVTRANDDRSDPNWIEKIEDCVQHLGNLRAALGWAFGETGDVEIGPALAAATAPLFLELSLLGECATWTARAIDTLEKPLLSSICELQLHEALASSLIFGKGSSDTLKATLERGLTIAENLGE